MSNKYVIRSGWGKKYYFSGYGKYGKYDVIPVYKSDINLAKKFNFYEEANRYAYEQLFSNFNYTIEENYE